MTSQVRHHPPGPLHSRRERGEIPGKIKTCGFGGRASGKTGTKGKERKLGSRLRKTGLLVDEQTPPSSSLPGSATAEISRRSSRGIPRVSSLRTSAKICSSSRSRLNYYDVKTGNGGRFFSKPRFSTMSLIDNHRHDCCSRIFLIENCPPLRILSSAFEFLRVSRKKNK